MSYPSGPVVLPLMYRDMLSLLFDEVYQRFFHHIRKGPVFLLRNPVQPRTEPFGAFP